MWWFCREIATFAKLESAIVSELFGLLGSNFQNKLFLVISKGGKKNEENLGGRVTFSKNIGWFDMEWP